MVAGEAGVVGEDIISDSFNVCLGICGVVLVKSELVQVKASVRLNRTDDCLVHRTATGGMLQLLFVTAAETRAMHAPSARLHIGNQTM